MNESIVIDTPANGLVTTSLVCLNCPLTIFDKDFRMDLSCFLLSQLDVILRMNWIEFNHVYINYFDKTILFLEPEESVDMRFVFAGQVEMSLRENDQVLLMFASLRVGRDVMVSGMLVVCEFPYVFPEGIRDLPLKHEVECAINLVPDIKLVSMAPYIIYASELGELKKQL